MNIAQVQLVVDEIRTEAREDYVGLWSVVRSVTESVESADSVRLRLYVADVCRALLSLGLVFGQFDHERVFQAWSLANPVDLILIQWGDLDRAPDIGEIGWFVDPAVMSDA